jgi:hypothetical protein
MKRHRKKSERRFVKKIESKLQNNSIITIYSDGCLSQHAKNKFGPKVTSQKKHPNTRILRHS